MTHLFHLSFYSTVSIHRERLDALIHSFFRLKIQRWISSIVLLIGGTGLILAAARGAESDDVVTVYSSVSPSYARATLPGGGFKPETYAFGEGGDQTGIQKDFSIDNLRFMDIARVIAPTLASKNYLPGPKSDPDRTDLLIMVYWGTTIGTDSTSSSAEYAIAQSLIPPPATPLSPPPTGRTDTAMVSDPTCSGRDSENAVANVIKSANDSLQQQSLVMSELANRQRDRQNVENATILGYLEEMKRVDGYQMAAFKQRRQDVIDEVEESRYYVVLMAYDFQQLLKQKEKHLRWVTRFSIRQRRNDFSKELAAMAESASRYFGQNSGGLKRKSLREEHINLGELEIIRVEPDKK